MNEKLPTLYARNKDGSIQMWKVGTSGNEVIVVFGRVGGALQSKTTICEAKNIGRSNETTAEEQAVLEAQSKWEKQVRLGYKENVEDLEAIDISPMLAQDASKKPHAIVYPCHLQSKLDGCFSYRTLVTTDKGRIPIGEIVENRLDVKALSYNEQTGELEFKRIKNWFNNGKKEYKDCYRFGQRNKRFITKNHKVLTDDGWKPIEGAEVMLSPNKTLLGIMTGMLLGDSCATFEKRQKTTERSRILWRMVFSHNVKDREYGIRKANILPFKVREQVTTSGYGSKIHGFVTESLSNVPYPIDIFYNTDRTSSEYGRRKSIDNAIQYYFTDESLAIWFFDDGTICWNNGNKLTPRISICVARYSEEDRQLLAKILKCRYGVDVTIQHSKNGQGADSTSFWFTTRDSMNLFYRICASKVGALLGRKIPEFFSHEYDDSEMPLMAYKEVKKVPVGERVAKTMKPQDFYDIEVEDNHNYFADNELVHNCRCFVHFERDGLPKFISRGNKEYGAKGNILRELQDLHEETGFDEFDGEFYIHGLPLQKITSLVKKWRSLEDIEKEIDKDFMADIKRREKAIKAGEETWKDFNKVDHLVYEEPVRDSDRYGGYCSYDLKLMVFDVPDCIHRWEDRATNLQEVIDYCEVNHLTNVEGVPFIVANNEEEVRNSIGQYMQDGYEGTIIRNFRGMYEYGQRSADLLKWKIFQDSEAKIIGVEKDKNGEGVLICEEKDGTQCKCKMKGTFAVRNYDKCCSYVGKFITIKFQQRTVDGVMQFPTGVAFRDLDPETWEPLD